MIFFVVWLAWAVCCFTSDLTGEGLANRTQAASEWPQVFVSSPPGELRSTAISVWMCLSVCLSVRWHVSTTTRPNFTKFSVRIACRRGSVLRRRQRNTLCTSGFVDDVMFSDNGANADTELRVCDVANCSRWHARCRRLLRTGGTVCCRRLPCLTASFTELHFLYISKW